MELVNLSIKESHEGLVKKKFSCVELTQAYLDRIKKVEPKINSFVTVTEKLALGQAKAVDKNGVEKKQMLSGVPAALKDVFCYEGVGATASSKILKGYIPPYHATSVARLKQQGMVLLGKTNTDEFTMGSSTETSAFGATKNPWDTTRVSGGSSGGSAAAVTAGECAYTLGTDTGGSIRQPAAFCGVTGLKVTYGRTSRFGVMSMASSLDTIGPLARSVEDIAYVLQAIAGSDTRDSTTPKVAIPDYLAALVGAEKSVKGLKIGLPKQYFIKGMDAEVETSVREAARIYEKMGAKIIEVDLPLTEYAVATYYIICPAEVSSNMARYDGVRYGSVEAAKTLYDTYAKTRARGFGDEVKRRIMIGTYVLSHGYYDAYYKQAMKVRTLIRQEFKKVFEGVDILLTPTTPTTAFKIGENADDPIKMYLADVFTIPASLAGIPGLALPAGFVDKLPVGVQLLAPWFAEAKLLSVGHAYQQVTNWHKERPSL